MLFIQKGDGFGDASKGPFESNDPKSTIIPAQLEDPMNKARRVFKKGRFETMGGPVIFEQCHGALGYEDNQRIMGYSPTQSFYKDPATEDLGVDVQE